MPKGVIIIIIKYNGVDNIKVGGIDIEEAHYKGEIIWLKGLSFKSGGPLHIIKTGGRVANVMTPEYVKKYDLNDAIYDAVGEGRYFTYAAEDYIINSTGTEQNHEEFINSLDYVIFHYLKNGKDGENVIEKRFLY